LHPRKLHQPKTMTSVGISIDINLSA
jgi:hypothetical protein